jgi:hypothetical protein
MIDFIVEAYNTLIENPKGMYYVEDSTNHGLTKKGIDAGVAVSVEEVNKLASDLSGNSTILEELESLDTIPRALEDLIPETDTYNYPKVLRKRELRSNLK